MQPDLGPERPSSVPASLDPANASNLASSAAEVGAEVLAHPIRTGMCTAAPPLPGAERSRTGDGSPH